MKVKKSTLLFIAGSVWFFAGFNILRIGLIAYDWHFEVLQIILSFAVFIAFHNMVFRKMVRKHTVRIREYEENLQPFYRFFNKQAYCIMAFMMTFGIGLRVSGLCPDIFIAVFYTGLGCSLLIAGVGFYINFARFQKESATITTLDEEE